MGELRITKKQARPLLAFTVADSLTQCERRLVAFDRIAEALASPETNLHPQEPITVFAWKHVNTVHINGQERTG